MSKETDGTLEYFTEESKQTIKVNPEESDDDLVEELAKLNMRLQKTIAGKVVVQLGKINAHNIKQFKKLNDSVFSIVYGSSVYESVLRSPDLARFAYFNDVPVGAITCSQEGEMIYIQTIGVLPAYRKHGIGALLLQFAINYAEKKENVLALFLHVQVSNHEAIRFYEKNGFTHVGTVKDFYEECTPRDAHNFVRPTGNRRIIKKM